MAATVRALAELQPDPATVVPLRYVLDLVDSWAMEAEAVPPLIDVLGSSYTGRLLASMKEDAQRANVRYERAAAELENRLQAEKAAKVERKRLRAEAHAVRMRGQAEHNRRWYAQQAQQKEKPGP